MNHDTIVVRDSAELQPDRNAIEEHVESCHTLESNHSCTSMQLAERQKTSLHDYRVSNSILAQQINTMTTLEPLVPTRAMSSEDCAWFDTHAGSSCEQVIDASRRLSSAGDPWERVKPMVKEIYARCTMTRLQEAMKRDFGFKAR